MVEDQVATISQHRVQASTSGAASGNLSTYTLFLIQSENVVKINNLGPHL